MPPAVGAAILAAAGISDVVLAGTVAAGTAVTLSAVVGYGVLSVASIGASYALNQAMQPDKKVKLNSEQLTLKQAMPPRLRGYGRSRLGGSRFFFGDNGVILFTGIVHCEGPIDGFEEWWLNDVFCNIAPSVGGGLSGGLASVLPWLGSVSVESHCGSITEPSSLDLLTYFPGTWTSAHQLKGLAYSVLACSLPPSPAKNFQKVYPNGIPALRTTCRLSKVYNHQAGQDPANPLTWTWSDNPALCILDYLTSARGFAIPRSRINQASFDAFTNRCNEPVPIITSETIPVGPSGGATVARYRLGGVYDLTEEPRDVLRRLLDTCDGEIYTLPDGTIGIRGGGWDGTSVTIAADMILGYDYQRANDKLAAFNRLKITFTDPLNDYQQIEALASDDTADQASTGQVLVKDFPLPMVQSFSQARRLAKIAMAKGNPIHQLTLTTNLGGLLALGERAVHLTLPELGIDLDFLVTKFAIAGDLTTCTIGLSSFDGTAYNWAASSEEGARPVVASTAIDVVPVIPAPQSITLQQIRIAIAGGTNLVEVEAACASPTDAFASFWTLIGQISPTGANTWTPMSTAGTDLVLSGPLTDGATYDVQVAFQGLGLQSAWSAIQSITVHSDITPPATPSGFTVAPSGLNFNLAWTNPNSLNLAGEHVYRTTGKTFSSPTLLGTVYGPASGAGAYVDAGAPLGIRYYWLAPINFSGTEGTPVGPVLNGPNLFPSSSNDPNTWPGAFSNSVTILGNVADPFGGTTARQIQFTTNAAGYYYANITGLGSVGGRTFDGSIYLKSASGKAQIYLEFTDSVTVIAGVIVTLTTIWQRIDVAQLFGGSATALQLGIENLNHGQNTTAGILEMFGGQLSESATVQTYQSRP